MRMIDIGSGPGTVSGTVTFASPMTEKAAHVAGDAPRAMAASFAVRAASPTVLPAASAR